MSEKTIVVVHGCCKGTRSDGDVRAESTEGALAVGADQPSVRSSYYACRLDQVVNTQGHETTMPEDCPAVSQPQMEAQPHDDDLWNRAIAERLADPSNADNVLALAGTLDIEPPAGIDLAAVSPATVGPLGPWIIGTKFVEFHAFVSPGHQPEGRGGVWEAIRDDFAGLGEGDYVLIAHSLGSIITASLLQHDEIPQPAAYVTVGSQLGWSLLSWFGLRPFHLHGHWVNIIDSDDPSAGFFSGSLTPKNTGYTADDYQDLWVENTNPNNAHDFVGYMQTADAVDTVGALV